MLPLEVDSSSLAESMVSSLVVLLSQMTEAGPGTLGGRSIDALLTMLVPCVLGVKGIFPVVALVTCEAQSPEYGPELLPSVVSLHLCFPDWSCRLSAELSTRSRM